MGGEWIDLAQDKAATRLLWTQYSAVGYKKLTEFIDCVSNC
jgi:hypothetical protein